MQPCFTQAATRVFLPSVFEAKETEFGSKAKKSFILCSENGEVRAPALEDVAPNKPWTELPYRVFLSVGSERTSPGGRRRRRRRRRATQGSSSRGFRRRRAAPGLQISRFQVQGLCTRPAAATMLDCSAVPRMAILHTLFQAEVSGEAISHLELWSEVLGARPLQTAPCEQEKVNEAQTKLEKKV